MTDDNLTAQEFIVWCVQTLSTLNDGPQFDQINKSFNEMIQQLDFLETCLRMDSYVKEE